MKKLLYFFLLFFFVGCSEAPKEQQIVMEYLKYNPDNIRRYKPLEWGKLDTIYSSAVDDDLLYIGYITEIMKANVWKQKLEEEILNLGTNVSYAMQLQNELDRVCKIEKAYKDKADSIYNNYIPHLTGYSIRHKYRAKKNTDNVVVYDEVFVLDSTLTKVVEVKKE